MILCCCVDQQQQHLRSHPAFFLRWCCWCRCCCCGISLFFPSFVVLVVVIHEVCIDSRRRHKTKLGSEVATASSSSVDSSRSCLSCSRVGWDVGGSTTRACVLLRYHIGLYICFVFSVGERFLSICMRGMFCANKRRPQSVVIAVIFPFLSSDWMDTLLSICRVVWCAMGIVERNDRATRR